MSLSISLDEEMLKTGLLLSVHVSIQYEAQFDSPIKYCSSQPLTFKLIIFLSSVPAHNSRPFFPLCFAVLESFCICKLVYQS
jgi:hypothetical protein